MNETHTEPEFTVWFWFTRVMLALSGVKLSSCSNHWRWPEAQQLTNGFLKAIYALIFYMLYFLKGVFEVMVEVLVFNNCRLPTTILGY